MAENQGQNVPQNPQNQFFQQLVNQLREPRNNTVRSIPCENYKPDKDFDSWVKLFEDSIRASNNLAEADQARFAALCVQWLPAKLEAGSARLVFESLEQNVKNDWTLLKPALSDAFKDKAEEISFLNDEKAWTRSGKSLRDYKNGLVLRMDKYQKNLRQIPDEWNKTAIRRFRAGLEDQFLDAHILMGCVGENRTLEHAFDIACSIENTVQTLKQSNSLQKTLPQNLASMLTFPQLSSLSTESPQLSALSAQGEKNEKRLEAIETSIRKGELDNSELKASLTEMRESIKEMKNDMAQDRMYRQTTMHRPFRPMYVPNRATGQTYSRPSYPQYRAQYPRPQGPPGIVSGLTGGPGFVTRQPIPHVNRGQNEPSPTANSESTHNVRGDNNQKAPTMATFEGQWGSEEVKQEYAPFANPHVQGGDYDLGHGWNYDADQNGYMTGPDSYMVYADYQHPF